MDSHSSADLANQLKLVNEFTTEHDSYSACYKAGKGGNKALVFTKKKLFLVGEEDSNGHHAILASLFFEEIIDLEYDVDANLDHFIKFTYEDPKSPLVVYLPNKETRENVMNYLIQARASYVQNAKYVLELIKQKNPQEYGSDEYSDHGIIGRAGGKMLIISNHHIFVVNDITSQSCTILQDISINDVSQAVDGSGYLYGDWLVKIILNNNETINLVVPNKHFVEKVIEAINIYTKK